MKINVLLSPISLDDLYFTGKTTIVIDVLRATSVICTALVNGAKEVIPVATFDYAMKISSSMFGGQTLLCGERNTKKIDGFHLGNSPFEYSKEVVNGKSIVLFTSNGTKAIVKAKFSKRIIICSFLNLSSVVEYLQELNEDLEILCSAKGSMLSLEDTICAGKLITDFLDKNSEVELTDSAVAATTLAKSLGKNIKKMMLNSEHGKILIENGFEEDIHLCSKIGSLDIIPVFSSNLIKPLVKSTNSN